MCVTTSATYEYCTLGYSGKGTQDAMSRPAIILVLKRDNHSLSILVRPGWETSTQIQEIDRDYIKDLLRDCIPRAQVDPDGLFAQICQLNVGPLITQEVGSYSSDSSLFRALLSEFVQFEG